MYVIEIETQSGWCPIGPVTSDKEELKRFALNLILAGEVIRLVKQR